MDIKKTVSMNLVKYRKAKGLTQKQLAEKIGVKNTSISNWEQGVSSLDIEMLAKICDVLSVGINDMYTVDTDLETEGTIRTGLEKIEFYRKEKGLTQKELSKLSGVPLGTLTKIITGETLDPKLETVKAIARILECTLDDLDNNSNESYHNERKVEQKNSKLGDDSNTSFNFVIPERLVDLAIQIEALPEEDREALYNVIATFLNLRNK